MMFGRGFNYNNGCFGYGSFSSGWNALIGIGIFIIIIVVIYLLMNKSKKTAFNDQALESLKMKYVHGEITEEEYLKRKNILNR